MPPREEILERARGLIPSLLQRADETENNRRIPDATIQDLHDTGIWKIVRPAKYGGWETDFGVMVEVAGELARGCASTSWVYTNIISHNWMLPMWPVEAHEAVWGENPDALIGSSLIYPPGKIEPADGGYILSGRWPYSSGIDASDWVMVGGMDPELGDGDKPGPRMFVVRAEDVEIIDTWHVSGMAGTGSHDIACDKLFVPDYMTLPAREIRGGQVSASSDADVYKLPVLGLFAHFLAYPVLGIAQGAYEDYVETLREQVSIYSNTRVGDHITIQLKIAEAGALIDTGRSIMRESGIEAHALIAAGEIPSAAHKTRWRRDAAYAAKGCVKALDLIFDACGGTANYLDNELQRRFRDIHAAAAQIQIVFDINGPEFSRVAIGLEPLNRNL